MTNRGLVRVLISLVPSSLAWAASMGVIGWLVFAATASPAFVGLAYTLRFAPLALVGVPVGALSDRLGPVRLLQGSGLVAAVISFAIVALSTRGSPPLAALLAASAALGIADSGRLVTAPNLVYDLAGDLGPTRAIAASSLVGGLGLVIGGALAGAALNEAGPGVAAAISGFGYGAATLLLIGVPPLATKHAAAPSSFPAAVRDGLALLRGVPTVGVLIAVALVVELFAFSSVALDPVFAGQVFRAGPAGLGVILAVRSIGRLGGSGALAAVRPRRSLGRVLAVAILGFGLALTAYAVVPSLLVAIPLLLGAGLAGALVDALVLTALQAAVDPGSRGRVAGLWVLMVGLQPIGVLEIGFMAQLAGGRFAQGLNGLVVTAFGLALFGTALGRRIREIQTVGPPPAGPGSIGL